MIRFLLFVSLLFIGNIFALERSLKLSKMHEEQRIALIIGTNSYTSFSPLKNPINDARAMKRSLEKKQFKTLYAEDISKREFKKMVKKFHKELLKGGTGLFFFAGHGIQVEGRNYLIASDSEIEAKEDVEFEAISLDFISSKMKSAKNRLNIVILDACRNDPFSRGAGGGLAPLQNARGMFVSYATEAGSVAQDGAGKNGVFTQALIKYIDEPIPIEQMFKKVRQEVFTRTDEKQYPGVMNNLLGDFFFTLPKSEPSQKKNIPTAVNAKKKVTYVAPVKRKTIIEEKQKVQATYIKPHMIRISKGSFLMGDNNSVGDKDEQPVHTVNIKKDFYIGKHEVSFEEYDKYCTDTGQSLPKSRKWGREQQPVINVSWYDATAYAEWLSKKTGEKYSLPTEAQWEYVAGAGRKNVYGDFSDTKNLDKYAWYKSNAKGKPHPVGKKQANHWGVKDMLGNVREWCLDTYTESYNYTSRDGSAYIDEGNMKVIRGGAWNQADSALRISNRFWAAPTKKSNNDGFRLVKEI